MTYVGPVRRRNSGRGHGYTDANGLKVPGVTTVVGNGLPKSGLIDWAADATAAYAVDHWDELGRLSPTARYKALQKCRYIDVDKAKDRGTQVHTIAEHLVRSEVVNVPDFLAGHVESYVRFLDEWDVRPVLVEAVVMSHTHGYAGTLDLVADLIDPDSPDERTLWLLDVKTGRSGIRGDVALQISGYRYADVYLDDDGNEQPMPEVERTGAIHVRADGYDLVPVEAGPAQHRALLYVQQVAEFAESSRGLVGEPLKPLEASAYRLVRDDDTL